MSNLFLVLVAALVSVAQQTEAQTLVTRVYDGNNFEGYSLDPPFWTYQANGFSHSKSAHWLYRNHHYVFIDIEVNFADLQ